MAKLLVSLQGAEFAFDLRGDGVKVGSGPDNGLVLKDSAISREHLELRRLGSAWRIVDLESAAGTRVNGLFVNKHDLKDGDVIAVGPAKLTFRAEESQAPGAAPAAAPIPVAAAPVPIAAAPVYATPVYAPPPPVHRPPPPAHHGRGRDRDRDRDRDDDRDRRRGRGGRHGGGGGGAGGAVAMVFIFLLVAGAIGAVVVLTQREAKKDPNVPILAQIRDYRSQGRHDLIVQFDGQGDPNFTYTIKEIRLAVTESKKILGERAAIASKEESDAYFRDQIKAPRTSRSLDGPSLVARCDDFLKRWPTHEKAEEALYIRLCLTGEPPPFWHQVRGGAAPGQGGYVSMGTLLGAAETEAGYYLADGNYAGAFRVYSMFEDRASATVLAEFRDQFRADLAKKREFITQKAKTAFDKLEEKAMVLEDRKNYEQVEALYKEARELYGVPEILIRCDAELERLRERRR